MTLNITIATPRAIFQCADYRLFDLDTRTPIDFQTQKVVAVNTFNWSALVAFAGVGRTHRVKVDEWLADAAKSISYDAPFERLIEKLTTAEEWLADVPPPNNRHSFSVGAFVGGVPAFVLVSNFEQPSGEQAAEASPKLSVFTVNAMWAKKETGEASRLYRAALELEPGQENASWNYAQFLLAEFNDTKSAREALDGAISKNPESGRLLLLRGEVSALEGNGEEALNFAQRARQKRADAAHVEALHATAVQLSGRSPGECIGAYRAAVAANPSNAPLTLNLAQVLFLDEDRDAYQQLLKAMRLGLDSAAQLEAQFYLLSHTPADVQSVIRTMRLLLREGARLKWNVAPNIELVERHDPQKALLLRRVAAVAATGSNDGELDRVVAEWPKEDRS